MSIISTETVSKRRFSRMALLLFAISIYQATNLYSTTGPTPRITGGTPQQFAGELICVCGYFPTAQSQNGITIDGKPWGVPVQASKNTLIFRLPADLTPGSHQIAGLSSADFSATDSITIVVLKINGYIDQQAIMRGQTTTMQVWVEGTTSVLKILLTNGTPQIIDLEGGIRQIATTSGGSPNSIKRKVRGIKRGDFVIDYALSEGSCPCDKDLPQDVDEAGTTDESTPDTPGDPISDEPPTVPAGTPSTSCPVQDVKGALEPSQGVWQDDPYFKQFQKKKAGNKLKKISETLYQADLPMVRGRPTLLFGTGDTNFDTILLEGTTTGSKPVRVDLLFTLFENNRKIKEIYRTPDQWDIYLDGTCGQPKAFTISIDTKNGVPPLPDHEFGMLASDSYRIEAELMRAGTSVATGIKIEVRGPVVDTNVPTLHFIPMVFSDTPDPVSPKMTDGDLQSISDSLAKDSEEYIDDYFPVEPDAVRTVTGKLRKRFGLQEFKIPDLSKLDPAKYDELRDVISEARGQRADQMKDFHKDLLRQIIQDDLVSGRKLAQEGVIILVLRSKDFTDFIPDEDPGGPSGISLADKLIVIRFNAKSDTVAHEFIHTREYPWHDNDMESECGVNYHNISETTANGHRIIYGITEDRLRITNMASIMGNGNPWWINQCSYMHLLINLQKPPDPRVILVRGLLAQKDGRVAGALLPAYQLDGIIDLPGAQDSKWAIVLRDQDGKTLARHPFEPVWRIPHTISDRHLISFSYRIEDHADAARIDLVGPSGLLSSRQFSKAPPEIRILSPEPHTITSVGKIKIEWSGLSTNGNGLLYSVLYSSDGGNIWIDEVFEQPVTSADVNIDAAGKKHLIKIIATDGARSTETIVQYH